MNKKQLITGIISIGLLSQPILVTNVYAVSQIQNTQLLKIGMRSQSVKELQLKLKKLGYFNYKITGYYGDITRNAVLKLQKDSGLAADGIVGKNTSKALSNKSTQVSRGSSRATALDEWSWFGKIKDIIPRGTTYKITDIKTGKSFNVKRTYGTNHADSETLTKEDTSIMKEIYGGAWSWARRAIIVEVGNYKLPASMAGMPHGSDFIRDNNMEGHFDVHFLKSKTHGTNRVEPKHQNAVKEAQKYLDEQSRAASSNEETKSASQTTDKPMYAEVLKDEKASSDNNKEIDTNYEFQDIYTKENLEYMRSDDQNDVVIDILYTNPITKDELQKENLVFNVYMNTHTYDITETNLAQKLTIKIDNRTIDNSEIKWNPDAVPEGHHVSGKVIVTKYVDTNEDITSIEITMNEVAGAKTRVFKWNKDNKI